MSDAIMATNIVVLTLIIITAVAIVATIIRLIKSIKIRRNRK